MTYIIVIIISVALSYILFGRRTHECSKSPGEELLTLLGHLENVYGDNAAEIKKLKQEVFLLSEKVNKPDKKHGT